MATKLATSLDFSMQAIKAPMNSQLSHHVGPVLHPCGGHGLLVLLPEQDGELLTAHAVQLHGQ